MGIFRTSAVLAGLAMVSMAVPASANMTSEADCSVEGGTIVKVKGSDYCLVAIRDKAYSDPIYDGNQLGVVECPGDKLNDGQYCLVPVTLREGANANTETATPPAAPAVTAPKTTSSTLTDTLMDKAKDKATDVATDAAKDEAKKLGKKAISKVK